MDWKQFIVGLTASIIWPAVIITILIIFKNELVIIITRFTRLKYKDLEFDFDFEEVKQKAEDLSFEPVQGNTAIKSIHPTSLEEQLLEAAKSMPSVAILFAWSSLETVISSTVSRLAILPNSPSGRSIMHNIEIMVSRGYLGKEYLTLLQEMRALRNKIAHAQLSILPISEEQAINYAETAIKLIKYFDGYQSNK